MQVIYFLLSLEMFQCLFELISVFLLVQPLFMRVFVSHLLNENDVNIFETIETDQQSEKFKCPQRRRARRNGCFRRLVHLLNLINELLLFLSISLIFDVSIHGRKNKTCATKTLFTNFIRATVMEQFVGESTCRRIDLCVIASFKYGRICSLF